MAFWQGQIHHDQRQRQEDVVGVGAGRSVSEGHGLEVADDHAEGGFDKEQKIESRNQGAVAEGDRELDEGVDQLRAAPERESEDDTGCTLDGEVHAGDGACAAIGREHVNATAYGTDDGDEGEQVVREAVAPDDVIGW